MRQSLLYKFASSNLALTTAELGDKAKDAKRGEARRADQAANQHASGNLELVQESLHRETV